MNTDVTIAAARGILQVIDPSRLAKNGRPATLSVPWGKSLLHRMNFTKRRGSTKGGIPPDDLEDARKIFLTDIVETVALNDIPGELIFNWDQTGINLVPRTKWTMDKKGKKQIEIARLQDKRQITAVLCGSFVGISTSTVNIWRQDQTMSSILHYWVISHSANHWSNEVTILQYIREVIVPFVGSVRQQLELPDTPCIYFYCKSSIKVAISS